MGESILYPIPFFKMSGSGNDFIIINNSKSEINLEDLPFFVRCICCRRLSVGADGVIFVEKSSVSDFKWTFFNSDGSIAEMCGNGARCVAKYAYYNNIVGKKMVFESPLGVMNAEIIGNLVEVEMPNPKKLRFSYQIKINDNELIFSTIDTGVPHAVLFVDDINKVDVFNIGRNICHHSFFHPDKINVNFVEISSVGVFVRTYERGVEDETLGCGTGIMAAAFVCVIHFGFKSPIFLNTRSGCRLSVSFKKKRNDFREVFLRGDARIIYSGMLWEEGWKYPKI